jgi:hypothetical protein
MAVLTTWDQYNTYIDANGYYRVIWQGAVTKQIIIHKFDSVKSLTYMERFFDKMINGSDGVVQEIEFPEEDEADFKVICAYIRSHPTLTLNQWNTYLTSLGWQKSVVFRAYMFKLALKLASKYNVVLANYTESEVWIKTRNWICNTNLDIVKRVIFGYLITL